VKRLDAALFTHTHTDHIMGFDDMRRFCEMEDRKMPIYATFETMEKLRESFRYAFDDPQPWKNYLRLEPHLLHGSFLLGETTIFPVELPHGRMKTIGYVLYRGERKLLAYFTDCASLPKEALEAAQGVDVLVIDALRDTPHPTHMNFEQALHASSLIAPERTYFTHLCHEVSHAEKEAILPEGTHLAYDGLTIQIGAS
jgi:phosphoribosyl 1,2-cyclic phosphate phosphodiesterase